MTTQCPVCGQETLVTRCGEFHLKPPVNIPGDEMVVQDASWFECTSCGEQILGHELSTAIELMRYDRLGLLSPKEIEGIRTRLGLTQVQMAELLGVGDKTYARWEAGKSIHNISSDNLIRLVAQNPELFARINTQRDPARRNRIAEYVQGLNQIKSGNPVAIAAHGGELDEGIGKILQKQLHEIISARKRG